MASPFQGFPVALELYTNCFILADMAFQSMGYVDLHFLPPAGLISVPHSRSSVICSSYRKCTRLSLWVFAHALLPAQLIFACSLAQNIDSFKEPCLTAQICIQCPCQELLQHLWLTLITACHR